MATGSSAVRAVLFDLDGTLVDSEAHTGSAIAELLAKYGAPGCSLSPEETHGHTWLDIAGTLVERFLGPAAVTPAALADELLARWMVLVHDVQPIPGAQAAVRAAAGRFALGIVSSSPRGVIDDFLARLGIDGAIAGDARVGAESVSRTKPHPEGYLLAARRLGVDPSACLVFEDSRAGLMAARAAGMRSVLVLHRAASPADSRPLADAACSDYSALPEGFWDELAAGTLALAGRSYP